MLDLAAKAREPMESLREFHVAKQRGYFGPHARRGIRGGSVPRGAVAGEENLPEDVRPYRRVPAPAYLSNPNLSPEANWAREEAHYRRHDQGQLSAQMAHGPYYRNGQLRIPSYFFNAEITPKANAEWKGRGLVYDGDVREWYIDLPIERAVEQVRRAKQRFNAVWGRMGKALPEVLALSALLLALLNKFFASELSEIEVRRRFLETLREHYRIEFRKGAREHGPEWQTGDAKVIDDLVSRQVPFLRSFLVDLGAGRVSEAQAFNRASMYAKSAKAAYHYGRLLRLEGKNLRWQMSPEAHHCVLAESLVVTQRGYIPIKDVRVGDQVLTHRGRWREVTGLFSHFVDGTIIKLTAGGETLTCTGEHPLWNGKAFVEARELRIGDNVILAQGFEQETLSQFSFPDAYDGESTLRQIGILRRIASSLFQLPFIQWLKSWMSMPPFTVDLDDDSRWWKVAIDKEFGFDEVLRFVIHVPVVQYLIKFALQIGRFIFTQLGVSFHQRDYSVRMSDHPLSDFVYNLGALHWIVGNHVLPRGFMHNPLIRLGSQTETQFMCLVAHMGNGQAKPFRRPARSSPGVPFSEKGGFRFIPNTEMQSGFSETFYAQTRFRSTVQILAAIAAQMVRRWLLCFGVQNVATPYTVTGLPVGVSVLSDETLTTPTFHILPPDNDALSNCKANTIIYYFAQVTNIARPVYFGRVYNLEVEEDESFVVDGFVVHNCTDCPKLHNQVHPAGWWIEYHIPQDERQECQVNCQCSLVLEP